MAGNLGSLAVDAGAAELLDLGRHPAPDITATDVAKSGVAAGMGEAVDPERRPFTEESGMMGRGETDDCKVSQSRRPPGKSTHAGRKEEDAEVGSSK